MAHNSNRLSRFRVISFFNYNCRLSSTSNARFRVSDRQLFSIYEYFSSKHDFLIAFLFFFPDVQRVSVIGREDRLHRNRIDSGLLVSLEMETPAFFGVGQKTAGASVLSVFGHHLYVHALVRR